MMSRFLLSIGFLAFSIVMPLTAHAYVTPEEALDDEDFTVRFYDPPPSRRQIQAAAKKAEEENAERLRQERAALGQSSSSSEAAAPIEEDEDLHGAAPNDDPTEEAKKTPDERRDERFLARIKAQQERNALEAQLRALGLDGTLHSGAPLSDTGPGTVVAILAVVAAVLWTLRTVWKEEKREF